MPRDICVDFDGVIHRYDSGWKGACNIPDPPVSGAFAWLEALIKHRQPGSDTATFRVNLYSSRSKEEGAIEAMQKWFLEHGFDKHLLTQMEFPVQKPAATMTVDDRAFCFAGLFPTIEWLLRFKPWNKNPDNVATPPTTYVQWELVSGEERRRLQIEAIDHLFASESLDEGVIEHAWTKATEALLKRLKGKAPRRPRIADHVANLASALGKHGLAFRQRLPEERDSKTVKFDIGDKVEGYITVSFFEDGAPGELFLAAAKEGDTIRGLLNTIAIAVSIGLQYGVPLRVFVDKFSHMRFQPSGFTGNATVPHAKSIVDFIFRFLGERYLNTPEDSKLVALEGPQEGAHDDPTKVSEVPIPPVSPPLRPSNGNGSEVVTSH